MMRFLETIVAPTALAGLLLSGLPAGAEGLEATRDARTFPFEDGDTVAIGLPFDTVTGELLGPNTCLTGYTSQTDTGGGGSFDESFVQVNDQLGMMRALNIDVAASGKLFGSSVSGKMKFAQQSAFAQNSLNYTLFASYAAPPTKIVPEPGKQIGVIGKHMKLLKRDEAEFRAKCGDAYVSTIFQGAEAFAKLSFLNVDQSKRQSLETSLKASGTGWSAEGSVGGTISTEEKSGRLEIVFNQTGGIDAAGVKSDDPVATKWDALVKTIEGIKGTKSPVTTAYQVVPYGPNLSNWDAPPLKPSPDIVLLVYYRAAYEALLNQLAGFVNDPLAARPARVLDRGRNAGAGDKTSISKLQTDILKARDAVVALMDACASWTATTTGGTCLDTDALHKALGSPDTPHPYQFMTRFPLAVTGGTDFFLSEAELANRIFAQNLGEARDAYCNQSRQQKSSHPACVDVAELQGRYLKDVQNNVTPAWFPAPGLYMFVSETRRDKICLTAQEKKSDNQRLFMRTCHFDAAVAEKQRFAWLATGQIKIRDGACVAGPEKSGAQLAPHNCVSKEGQQMWRFIPTGTTPLPRKDAVHGMLQEAAFGRCLDAGVPQSGGLTYVVTKPCDPTNRNMLWTAMPHK